MTRPMKPRSARRALLDVIWRQPLWAIPFAIFFGTQFGTTLHAYAMAYRMSLAFAYLIGLALWAARYVALRDYYAVPEDARTSPTWRVGLTYMVAALIGSYAAAILIHFTIYHGFLGSAQAIAVSGMYTVLFASLFMGISYAMVFHRQSLERAQMVEKIRAELAEAELRALRAQINPHFLFNTLNSIAALIHENPTAAEDVTTRLADVFRYVLHASERERVPLGEELAFLRSYLEIERVRLGDRLRIEEAIDPGVESIPVPSLLLQPLVENAVLHGVAPRAEGGTIRVSARRAGETLEVEITDDGPGLNSAAPGLERGFGLRSVRERLRALGGVHALAIDRASPGPGGPSSPEHPGVGTCVRITFPITRDTSSPSKGDVS